MWSLKIPYRKEYHGPVIIRTSCYEKLPVELRSNFTTCPARFIEPTHEVKHEDDDSGTTLALGAIFLAEIATSSSSSSDDTLFNSSPDITDTPDATIGGDFGGGDGGGGGASGDF